MKWVVITLVGLLIFLQYEFWFAKGSMITILKLKNSIAVQKAENKRLKERNRVLVADIKDLKQGNEAVEERARNELGMVKKGEVFYQIVPHEKKQS